MRVPNEDCLFGYRPPFDMGIGFGKCGQNGLEIKALGNLELAGGRGGSQFDDVDFFKLL